MDGTRPLSPTSLGHERSSEEKTTRNPSDIEKSVPEAKPEYLSGFKLAGVLVSVTLVYFLVMLDAAIISTAIPQITTTFNSILDIGWYGSAYQLTSAASQPLSGKIYTHFNIKAS